jgi:hypothetical protein
MCRLCAICRGSVREASPSRSVGGVEDRVPLHACRGGLRSSAIALGLAVGTFVLGVFILGRGRRDSKGITATEPP